MLLIRFPDATDRPWPDIVDAVRCYGDSVAGILRSAEQSRQKLRHAQCEERAAIARELHDSLAQSLSYLKVQASLLQSALSTPPDTISRGSISGPVKELRDTLNIAYRQLRDLITTFRVTMHGKTFAQALEDSVEELERRKYDDTEFVFLRHH